MISNEALERELRQADPLIGSPASMKSVAEQVHDTLVWDAVHPVTTGGGVRATRPRTRDDRSRARAGRHRLVLTGVAAAGLVTAAVLALLVAEASGDSAHPSVSAAALYRLAADVRSSHVVEPTTRTTVEDVLDSVETTEGTAWFRQRVVLEATAGATSTDYTYSYQPPRFLTPEDARRAGYPALDPDRRIRSGVVHQHDDSCGADCSYVPARLIAGLPTTDPDALLAAYRRLIIPVIGGCGEGPTCAAVDFVDLLQLPGISPALRATAIRGLATAPGITTHGRTTVAGRTGLTVDNRYGGTEAGDQRFVLDTRDGLLLSGTDYATAADKREAGYPVPVGAVIYTRQIVAPPGK